MALTDQSRGPFTIQTESYQVPVAFADPETKWRWRAIGSDGKCLEEGSGYDSGTEARRFAEAVLNNDMA